MESLDGFGYEGFVVDLALAISKIVGFNFTIVPTDGYGSVGKDGRWNGMIRELLEEVKINSPRHPSLKPVTLNVQLHFHQWLSFECTAI